MSRHSESGESNKQAAIARRAYQRWEERGRPYGDDQADWFEAEREVDGRESEARAESAPGRSGQPQRTPETTAEQAREASESQRARQAGPSNRERMVDIGRGNQQSGRQKG